ncbi:MAG: hypothetical protein EXS69_02085 [Candidatus Zambryskibacteria bacterium]|nr:hypothetical protein [Candidatus Zambryskibacteria bacterium]
MNLKMKTKLLYILILAVLTAGIFYAGWYTHQPVASLNLEGPETARLRIDGEELKILTNTYSTNRNFVFLDVKYGTDGVVGTLSVENGWGESPYYRIVKGKTHDWLVVTRIESGGTGFRTHSDEWYILGWSYEAKKVLSYQSDGNMVPDDEDGKNKYWRTDIPNESYLDDSAVDIKVTEKICSPADNAKDKDCTESSRIVHYIWDADKEVFVLKK